MDKNELISKIKKGGFTNEQLIGWVGALGVGLKNKKPTVFKVGDVFMHSVFKHPYVLLAKSKEGWVCGLLTSESTCAEILEPCKSRFFSENYFTKVLFIVTNVDGSFYGVYDNSKQLKDIKKELLKILI
tara:strand:+ start:3965 stop:4351 length:387 start_codon:yes stop_codon:yes gene_type:complete